MNLTENALAQFKKMIEEGENPKFGIRFFTAQGCCSPILQLEMVPSPQEGDLVVKIGEVDFFFTPEADSILSELTIDYSNGTFHSIKQPMNDA